MPSSIEWTDETWQISYGCCEITPGCDNCYARQLAGTRLQRLPTYNGLTDPLIGWTGEIRLASDKQLEKPLHWRKPRMIFVNSMSDFFHARIPREHTAKAFAVMKEAKQHTFQVLTKRPENIASRLPDDWGDGYPNVWLGISVEDQRRAEQRIPELLSVPAAVRFLSVEPLLGPISISTWISREDCRVCLNGRELISMDGIVPCPMCLSPISWVIIGGESGLNARPMEIDWARKLITECLHYGGISIFLKQLGGPVGAKRGGEEAVIDGRRYVEFPRGW